MYKVVLGLFFVLSVAACAESGGPSVEMTADQAFDPRQLTVDAGDTVTFNNASSEAHTVTAYEEEIPEEADYFTSGGLPSQEAARDQLAAALIAAGDTYEVTFEEAGTYRYFCIPHEEAGMKGTIVVEG